VLLLANWQRTGKRSGAPSPLDRPGLDEPRVRSRQTEPAPVLKPGDVLDDGEVVLGPSDLNALFDKLEA
jgi:hypothetical protein